MTEIYNKLSEIQQNLNAPKNQFNSFGKYKYRNCEDILEALKPLLGECCVTLSDEMVMVGERFYIKATAFLWSEGSSIGVSAYARESLDKKGMDSAQITGAASSYARKYALNGLFLIDDNKDADTDENTVQQNNPQAQQQYQDDDKPWYNDLDKDYGEISDQIVSGKKTAKQIIEHLCKSFKVNKEVRASIKDMVSDNNDVIDTEQPNHQG